MHSVGFVSSAQSFSSSFLLEGGGEDISLSYAFTISISPNKMLIYEKKLKWTVNEVNGHFSPKQNK